MARGILGVTGSFTAEHEEVPGGHGEGAPRFRRTTSGGDGLALVLNCLRDGVDLDDLAKTTPSARHIQRTDTKHRAFIRMPDD